MRFTDAASVFSNPLARIFPDEEHSENEVREIIIGHSNVQHLLVVCFTETGLDHLRIISAPAQPRQNNAVMKNTSKSKAKAKKGSELQAEYRFDYSKSKPNRFATRIEPGAVAVLLDPAVARVFKSAESVNGVLRAVAAAMPRRGPQTTR